MTIPAWTYRQSLACSLGQRVATFDSIEGLSDRANVLDRPVVSFCAQALVATSHGLRRAHFNVGRRNRSQAFTCCAKLSILHAHAAVHRVAVSQAEWMVRLAAIRLDDDQAQDH